MMVLCWVPLIIRHLKNHNCDNHPCDSSRVWDAFPGLGFRVWGLGFRVSGLGCSVVSRKRNRK